MPKPEFTFRYRVRNWPEHNQALVGRGRLTLWFDKTAVAGRLATDDSDGPGRPRVYADSTIECALPLETVFHLSLRATQGLLESVLALLRLELPVPDYSTLSRRQPRLAMTLPYPTSQRPRHIVIDSTGVKVYGAGDWHAGNLRAQSSPHLAQAPPWRRGDDQGSRRRTSHDKSRSGQQALAAVAFSSDGEHRPGVG